MIAKTQCDHCAGPLEFEAEDFVPGTTIECPHCNTTTGLTLPTPKRDQTKPAPPRVQWTPPPKPELIEDQLESIATAYFAVGILAAGICLFGCFIAGFEYGAPSVIALIMAAAIFIGQGWVISTLFRALAEIVRQLRKANLKK